MGYLNTSVASKFRQTGIIRQLKKWLAGDLTGALSVKNNGDFRTQRKVFTPPLSCLNPNFSWQRNFVATTLQYCLIMFDFCD